MKILAIDTSTISGSVAVTEDLRLLAEWTFPSAQTHNRRLLKMVDELLHEAGVALDAVDGLAVTIGPGSFTGVRIGMTTVKTLAWAANKPYAGVPSLDALAAPLGYASQPVCACIDAHKKEVFCALYQPDGKGNQHRPGPFQVIPPDRLIERIDKPTIFCGDGWLLYRDLLKKGLGDLAIEASGPYHTIRAASVALLARKMFLEGKAEDPVASVPLYIRPSDAEINYPHLSGHL